MAGLAIIRTLGFGMNRGSRVFARIVRNMSIATIKWREDPYPSEFSLAIGDVSSHTTPPGR